MLDEVLNQRIAGDLILGVGDDQVLLRKGRHSVGHLFLSCWIFEADFGLERGNSLLIQIYSILYLWLTKCISGCLCKTASRQ